MKSSKKRTILGSLNIGSFILLGAVSNQISQKLVVAVSADSRHVNQHQIVVTGSIDSGTSFKVIDDNGKETQVKLCGITGPGEENELAEKV